MRKIALISLIPIHAFAMQTLILEAETAIIDVFDDVDDFLPTAEKYDLYVVDGGVVLGNIEYFISKKTRLLAVIDSPRVSCKSFMAVNPAGSMEEIRTAIERFLNEGMVLSEETLTSREVEVLREISTGKTQKEIADCLSISVSTVITHKKNISSKLGIRSVSGLTLYAMMNGII